MKCDPSVLPTSRHWTQNHYSWVWTSCNTFREHRSYSTTQAHAHERPVTNLSVRDVGGTRATYKIQNKGSVLSAYRKNISQDQTPKTQQQEPMMRRSRWRREKESRSSTPKHQQRRTVSKSAADKKPEAKQLWQKQEMLTLRGLSTYVGAVAAPAGSLTAAEGFACCSSRVLTWSMKSEGYDRLRGSLTTNMR